MVEDCSSSRRTAKRRPSLSSQPQQLQQQQKQQLKMTPGAEDDFQLPSVSELIPQPKKRQRRSSLRGSSSSSSSPRRGSNNDTGSSVLSLDEEEEEATSRNKKAKTKKTKSVHFSEAAPKEISCSNYEEGMSEAERRNVRSRLWYTRQEFDDFLEDRLQTIRLLRSLNGNSSLLEPHYCLRGLEPYQSQRFNEELNSQRLLHLHTILREQTRQQRLGVYEPARFTALVREISKGAMQRAERLAQLDATEARRELLFGMNPPNSSSGTTLSSFNGNNSVSNLLDDIPRLIQRHQQRRQQAAATTATGFDCSGSFILPGRRASLPGYIGNSGGGNYIMGNTFGLGATTRNPVDVNQLKEWNKQLLQKMMLGNNNNSTSIKNILPGSNHNSSSKPYSISMDSDCSETDMSLHSLMATARRDSLSLAGSISYNNSNSNHFNSRTTLGRAATAAYRQRSMSSGDLVERSQRHQHALEVVSAAVTGMDSAI